MKRTKQLLIALALIFITTNLASAANKALLIGVGEYLDPRDNLPGIDLDVQRMHRLANSMGYSETQIHTLMNKSATLAAIQTELNGWFRAGVAPGDHLLLYFTSHGSLVRGPRGEVGAIIPHDVRRAHGTLENVLTGPELASILESNPSRNILLVVDACHSGGLTSQKGITRDFVPKVLRYPGMPSGDLTADLFTSGAEPTKDVAQPNYAYLSACRRYEVAGATQEGSILTLALEAGWNQLRQSRQKASLQNVHPLTLALIQKIHINSQNPEIFGDPQLLALDWFGHAQSAAPPPVSAGKTKAWEFWEQVSATAAGPLQAGIAKADYLKGELMDIAVNVPRDGYLFILSVGEGDEKATLLFPNKWQPNNHVSPGNLQIPQTGANWHIRQGLPPGLAQQNVLLVVVLSNSGEDLKGMLSGNGAFKDVDIPVESTRTPFPEESASSSGYLAGRLTYYIKE